MSINGSDSREQVELARAAVRTTRASSGWLGGWVQTHVATPEKDGHAGPTEHLIMDGFIWHSMSCICKCCVRNDNTFCVQFNRQDFRPYMVADAPSLT